MRPVVRTYVVNNKPSQFVTGGAVAYALARGAPENALLVVPTGNQVFLRNRKGDVLVDLDDNRARTLGAWQVAPLNDRVKGGAPGFCRSGVGHPVWGRQWCLDKGFGLGAQQNVRWGTTRSVSDIIFVRRVSSGVISRDALLSLLGRWRSTGWRCMPSGLATPIHSPTCGTAKRPDPTCYLCVRTAFQSPSSLTPIAISGRS